MPLDLDPQALTRAFTLVTSADYFAAVGMSLVQGRGFVETDDGDGPPVAIVNEAFVKYFLSGADPIGLRIVSQLDEILRGGQQVSREIVGVVNDARERGLAQAAAPTI